jgi:hypothetical protein
MLIPVRVWSILSRVCLLSCFAVGATTASFGQTASETQMEKTNSRSESQGSHGTTGQLSITVDSVRLVVSPQTGNRKPVEITGWNESKAFLLFPSRKFDLVCRLYEGEASYSGDFLEAVMKFMRVV